MKEEKNKVLLFFHPKRTVLLSPFNVKRNRSLLITVTITTINTITITAPIPVFPLLNKLIKRGQEKCEGEKTSGKNIYLYTEADEILKVKRKTVTRY